MKEFFEAFLYLRFVFVIFWKKEIGANKNHKLLVKLTKKFIFEIDAKELSFQKMQ
jgi:hypothetical protein